MRLGLLADIHEEVEHLRAAIRALREAGASQFVVLGDIFDTGRRIDETVAVLSDLGSVGVWGNHDIGLCREVTESIRTRYSPRVLDYFATLQPWLEVQGCRFQHIEPFLDSESLEDLWSYGGEGQLDFARSFACCAGPRLFMGHIHLWRLFTPEGPLAWAGEGPARLGPGQRYLAVVHAVQQGWCAWYDVADDLLCPLRVS